MGVKRNSPTSGADHVDAPDVDVLAALTTDEPESGAPESPRGLAQRLSSLTGAAVLAIGAAIIAIGLAGGAASAAAASIPASGAMAVGDTAAAAAAATAAAHVAATPAQESGPVQAGRWEYSLAPVQWRQRDTVLAANVAPAPQPAGYGWALVELSVRNIGGEEATPGRFEVVLHTGGWTVSHLELAQQPVRMPGEFSTHVLQPGEEATGNLGFWLPDHAAESEDCVIELRLRASTEASYTSHWMPCD